MIENLIDSVRKNKLIALLFAFLLVFFIYQHNSGFSWDFAAYSLNAKYLLHNGNFFEWPRAPFSSFLLGIFGFFGMVAAEYIFIIFVALLFLYSSLQFAQAMKIDKTAYHVFVINAAVVIFGLQTGTELLSLALLQLFVAELRSRRSALGLALLTRYQNFIYLPLLFFKKKLKEILIAILVIAAMFSPWLVYNFILTGNAFSSFIDFYLINFRLRESTISFSLLDLIIMLGTTLPFFAYGLYKCKKLKKNDYIMIMIFLITLISYSFIAVKYPRFLFSAIMPAAYFAANAIEKIRRKEIILLSITIINIAIVLLAVYIFPQALNEGTYHYKLAASNCSSVSNVWIAINYYGGHAEPTISNVIDGKLIETDINKTLSDGKRMILFKHASEPSYVKNASFLKQFPILKENDVFIVLGDACNKNGKIDKTFFDMFNSVFYETYGYRISRKAID